MSRGTPKRFALQLLFLTVLFTPFVLPAHASLLITPTFDSSITSDSNAASIEGAINSAIQMFDNLYSNPITVSIYFQEGGGLGDSNTVVYEGAYTTVYSALVATDANPAAIAALNANGGDPFTNGFVNPEGGVNEIEIKSANARALGFNVAPGCVVTPTGNGHSGNNVPNICALSGSGVSVDGIVSLQTAITDPPNSPQSSYYDLLSTAEHEIDEVLGLGSAIENCNPTSNGASTVCVDGSLNAGNNTPFGVGTLEDLYRWNAPAGGIRSTLNINCSSPTSAYFEYGPNTGKIAQFNNACNGADFGDWESNPIPAGVGAQVQDAFAAPGQTPVYGQSEIDAMTAIGYTLATPEPGTLAMFGVGLAMLAAAKRLGELKRNLPK